MESLRDCAEIRANRRIQKGEKRSVVIDDEGAKLVDEYISLLERCPNTDDAWCFVHKKKCACYTKGSVGGDGSGEKVLHVEVVGNSCQPWSREGNSWRWLDRRSIPYF
eukprot:5136735-Alexandrium_andersonii.AAC.1